MEVKRPRRERYTSHTENTESEEELPVFWCITSGLRGSRRRSVDANAIVGVPLRTVGQDDPVAGFEAFDDLDGIDGAAAEFHLRAVGVDAFGIEFEEADGAAFLAKRRAADVDDVIEPLQFDCAIDG